jgi:hypothetical protein
VLCCFLSWRESVSLRWLLLLALLLPISCAATFVSSYDEQIDKAATTLQVKMDTFLTGLEALPQPTYSKSSSFYTDYDIALRSILIRAESHPKNSLTAMQLGLMTKSVDDLREMHKSGHLDQAAIAITRDLFNQSWRAVIALEVAKKR